MEPERRPIGYWLKHLDGLIERAFEGALGTAGLTRRHWQCALSDRGSVCDHAVHVPLTMEMRAFLKHRARHSLERLPFRGGRLESPLNLALARASSFAQARYRAGPTMSSFEARTAVRNASADASTLFLPSRLAMGSSTQPSSGGNRRVKPSVSISTYTPPLTLDEVRKRVRAPEVAAVPACRKPLVCMHVHVVLTDFHGIQETEWACRESG